MDPLNPGGMHFQETPFFSGSEVPTAEQIAQALEASHLLYGDHTYNPSNNPLLRLEYSETVLQVRREGRVARALSKIGLGQYETLETLDRSYTPLEQAV